MVALRDALRSVTDDVPYDLLETADTYLLVIDVPGATADALDVTVADGVVHVEARRKKPGSGDHRYLTEERPLYHDLRLPVPANADGGTATATIDRGVLEVTVRKRGSVNDRTVEVVDAEAADAAAEP